MNSVLTSAIGTVLQKEGADLTAAGRAHIAKKNFAIPSKAKTPKAKKESGNYPIPDAAHARNALARVSQHGSSEEKAQVRAKVHSKFPGIGKESAMQPRLQAGVELVLEKTAAEKAGVGMLTGSLNQKLQKLSEDQGVKQEAAAGQGSAPADKGMEQRNKSFGKGTTDTDYDKKSGGEQTGKTTNLNGAGNVTSEASCAEKKASLSSNARILRTMLGAQL